MLRLRRLNSFLAVGFLALLVACSSPATPVESAGNTVDSTAGETPSEPTPAPFVYADDDYEVVDWKLFAKSTFTETYIEEENAKFWIPEFSPELAAYDGQPIQMSGYLLPLEPEVNFYVLSANPNSACFFCGAAGPETVVKLKVLETDKEFYMDNYLTFRGVLKLNSKDLYKMNFILDQAEVVYD